MNEREMLRMLEEHHRTIRAGIDEVRSFCEAASPSSKELGAARSRLSEASLARSKFVSEEVLPRLLEDADADLRFDLLKLVSVFAAKRQLSNEHVAKWTLLTIEQDWAGYCAAAKVIWAMMENQLDSERRYLAARLNIGSETVTVG